MKQEQNFWKNRIKESAVLNPVDRIAEVLFGLIMVLSFTGSISIATDGREEVRELLWAALGCNIAWGFVDAIMYLMNVAIERGHALKMILKIHQTNSPDEAEKTLRGEIQPTIAGLLTKEELSEVSNRLRKLPVPAKKNLIIGTDLMAGVQIFLLVFLCTFPVALPFAFFDEVSVAMRASNSVALFLLFVGGFLLAGYAGFRRMLTALVYTIIGVLLVTLTIALGG